MRAILAFAILASVCSTAYAKWPPEDCAAAENDINDLRKQAQAARKSAQELQTKVQEAKDAEQWQNFVDALVTIAIMERTVLRNAVGLAKSVVTKLKLFKDIVSDPLRALETALGVDVATALKQRIAQRKHGLPILEAAAKSANDGASAIEVTVAELNKELARLCR